MTRVVIICDECGEYLWPEEDARACERCEAVVHASCSGIHQEDHDLEDR